MDRMQRAVENKDEFLADEKRAQDHAADKLKNNRQSSFLWRALAPEAVYRAQKSREGFARSLASTVASGAKRAAVAGLKGAGSALLDFIEPKAVRAVREWIGDRRSLARDRKDDEASEVADAAKSASQSAETAAISAQTAAKAAVQAAQSKDDQTAKNVEETATASKAVAAAAEQSVRQDRQSTSTMTELLEEQFSIQNEHNRRILELLENRDDDDGGSLIGDVISGVGAILAGAGAGWAWLKALRDRKKGDADVLAKTVAKAADAQSAAAASKIAAAEADAKASKARMDAAEARVVAAESRASAAVSKMRASAAEAAVEAAESTTSKAVAAAGRQASRASTMAQSIESLETQSRGLFDRVSAAGRMVSASTKKAAESIDAVRMEIASAAKVISTSVSSAAKAVTGLSDRIPSITDDVSKAAGKVATDIENARTLSGRSVDSLSGTAGKVAMDMDRAGAMANRSVMSLSSRAGRLFSSLSESIRSLDTSLADRIAASRDRIQDSGRSLLARFIRLDDAVAADSTAIRSRVGRLRGAAAVESASVRAAISAESDTVRAGISNLRTSVDDAGRAAGAALRTASESADNIVTDIAIADKMASSSAHRAAQSVSALSGKATVMADTIVKTAGKVAMDMDHASIAASRSVSALSRSATAVDGLDARIKTVEQSVDGARVAVRSGMDRISDSVGRFDVSKGDGIASRLDTMNTSLHQSMTRTETRIGAISSRLQEGIGRIDQAMSRMAKKIEDSRVGTVMRQASDSLRRGGVDRTLPIGSSSSYAPTRRTAGARGGRVLPPPTDTFPFESRAMRPAAAIPKAAAKTGSAAVAGVFGRALVATASPVNLAIGVGTELLLPTDVGDATLDAKYKAALKMATRELPVLLSRGRSALLDASAKSPADVYNALAQFIAPFYNELPPHIRDRHDSGPLSSAWWQAKASAFIDSPQKLLNMTQRGGSGYAAPLMSILPIREGGRGVSGERANRLKRQILESAPKTPIETLVFHYVRTKMPLQAAAPKESSSILSSIGRFFGFGNDGAQAATVVPDDGPSRIPDSMSPTNMTTQATRNAVRQEMESQESKRADRTASGRPTGFGQETASAAAPITGTGNQQGRSIPSNVSDMSMLIALTEGDDRDLRDLVE